MGFWTKGSLLVLGLGHSAFLGAMIGEEAFFLWPIWSLLVLAYYLSHHRVVELGRLDWADSLAIIVGALGALALQQELGISVVMASALVGCLGAMVDHFFKQKWAVALYCGSFLGMSQLPLSWPYLSMLAAASFTALLYGFSAPYFKGVGGKLGSLAFLGVLLMQLVGFLLG